MGKQLFANNATSTLSGSLAQGGLTLSCSAGEGNRFPTPTAGDFFLMTIYTKDAYANEQQVEVVKVTARAGDVFTIERDVENLVGIAGGNAYNSSTVPAYLELRWTALGAASMLQSGANLTDLPDKSAARTALGLGNVNNTADMDKPVSTAMSAALGNKADSGHTHTKAAIGLGNVDNTSDLDKPVSTLTATALAGKANNGHTHVISDVTGLTAALGNKQDSLVSGTNIKTIGGASILGSGDIVIDSSALATQAEAEAGTESNIRKFSPLRIAQAIASLGSASVGDVIASTRVLAAPKWLPADGATYLQSSYPELFALIGKSDLFRYAPKVNVSNANVTSGASVTCDPTSTYFVVVGAGSIKHSIFKRNGDIFTPISGVNISIGGDATDCAFDPTGTYLAISSSATPYIQIYKRTVDTFTKVLDPTFISLGSATCCEFDSTGTYLAVTAESGSKLFLYKRTGDTFTFLSSGLVGGTNPANVQHCDFSANGQYLAVVGQSAPYMAIYKKDAGDTFTAISLPSTVPNNLFCVSFDPTGNYMAVGGGGAKQYLAVYKQDGDTFKRLLLKESPPNSILGDVCWSSDSKYLAVPNSGELSIYQRHGDVFSLIDSPPDLLNSMYGCIFDPTDTYLLTAAAYPAPYFTIHKQSYNASTLFAVPRTNYPVNGTINYVRAKP